MTRFREAVLLSTCCSILFLEGPTGGQQPPAAGNTGSSQESYVLEQKTCKIVLEKDGTSTQEVSVRVRIQSPAALQAFGILRVPYASGTSTLEVVYVRARKPGGQVVETPKENTMEMPADITRLAPYYSDIKENHSAVKGLEVGDALEYQFRVHTHSPIDPRHFWMAYEFTKQGIVLKEELEVQTPREQYVNVRSPRHPFTTVEQGPYRIYSWQWSRLQNKPEPAQANQTPPKLPDPPDVLVSTYRSWEEVGAWFRELAAPRAAATPEIRAKSEELAHGAADDERRIQAIYGYVSTKFRYIGVALGIGRYQPHAAAEVLANGYGDCKDKFVLLAALLAGASIPADAALVNTSGKIDPEIPSPGQFDHVVAAVPRGQELTWMDPTLEVAPLGYLSPTVRGERALLIPPQGAARLVETPADPPFLSALDFEIDGTLDDSGTLTAKVKMTTRGDLEVLLRSAFHQAGPAQWNEVMQRISGNLGFGGTVSDVTADPPEAADTAFHIRYQYVRKELGDWPNRRVPAPLPPVFLPEAPEGSPKNSEPLELGTPTNVKLRASMKLPAGSSPQLPSPLNIKQDFGTYRSSAEFSQGALLVEREFTQKLRAVPPAELESYRKFRQSVLEEWTALIPLHAGGGMEALAPSRNSDAQDAFDQGRQAMQQGDTNAAIRWFQSAIERDPNFAQAWVAMSTVHFGLGMLTSAAGEMGKAIALNSSLAPRGKMLARELMRRGWREDALPLLRAVEKADPRDADAPKNIATILFGFKRNAEAVAELEAARERFPEDAQLWLLLGHAYVRAGKNEDGVSAVQKSVELDPRALNLNAAGYQLAEDNADLEEALKYAQRAVGAMEKETELISLDSIGEQDLRSMARLFAYWDTLGWVYFKVKRLGPAESYLRAAWKLGEDPVVGDHLGQVLEKQGKTEQAGHMYARAVAAGHPPAETLDRLVALRHSRSAATQEVDRARGELGEGRSVKLPQLTPQSATADFYLLFEHAAQPKEVRFIKGADSLRAAGDALRAARYDVPFPEEAGTRIVRRGTVSCERTPPGCMLVLIPATIAQFDAPIVESSRPAAPAGPWTAAALPFRPFQISARGEALWVCGTQEGIAVSRDGGKSWQVKHQSESGELLIQIAALDEKVVYAAGTHGLLLWSQDAGETWNTHRAGLETPQRISMADQRHGIRQVAGRVEMTADGGAHWTEVSALKNDEKVRSFSEILGLAALDASHAAITLHQPQGENGFLSTQDAGATWKFVHLENTFAGMLFTHAGEYWAFGIEYVHREVRGGYGVPAALHSADGEHWTRGARAPHEFTDCAAQGCSLWDGAVVDLYGDKPAYWITPQDGLLTGKWAMAGGKICSVGRALKCAFAERAAEPLERPEEDRPILLAIEQPPLSEDCLACEFPSFGTRNQWRLTGPIVADFVIRKDGTADRASVSGAPDEEVAGAVREQIEAFLFIPPRQDGTPIEKRVHFQLNLHCSALAGNAQGSCRAITSGRSITLPP